MHKNIAPAIQYWGTPVVLVSTLNQDRSVNVSPMSSAWWLGWSCMLGLDASSHTVSNLERERECVLNLASAENSDAVNALALTTGARNVPIHKKLLGYRYVADKVGHASLTTMPSEAVRTPRIAQCQVQLEAVVTSVRSFARDDPRMAVPACAVEVRIVRVHVDESLLAGTDKIDPNAWRPLLMSFRELFGLGERVKRSRLAQGDESAYAPWRQGPLKRVAAKVIGAVLEHRYGVKDDDADSSQPVE